MFGGVFICYRPEDSAGFARLINDRLANRLGRDSVFFQGDYLQTRGGFADILSEGVGKCDALIAVIGKNWVSAADTNYERRLDNPDDFVRIEIETALNRGVRVIPVLVDGATMPRREDLPDSLQKLRRRQAIEISEARFDADVESLTHTLSLLAEELRRRDTTDAESGVPKEREKREAGEASEKTERVQQPAAVEGTRALEEHRAREAAEAEREMQEPEKREAEAGDLGERATRPRYYVSYARSDGSDPNRERDVDRLCEEARRRGISVLRDKKDLRHGELISDFMKQLGEGDKVFIFLSDKYLKSPYCMFELFELWRNSKQNKADFLRHVRVFTIDGVKIADSTNRLEYTKIWKLNRDGLRRAIDDIGWEEVGERAIEEYFRMKTFTSQVSDLLAVFADVLQAKTLEEFLEYGLDEQSPPLH